MAAGTEFICPHGVWAGGGEPWGQAFFVWNIKSRRSNIGFLKCAFKFLEMPRWIVHTALWPKSFLVGSKKPHSCEELIMDF